MLCAHIPIVEVRMRLWSCMSQSLCTPVSSPGCPDQGHARGLLGCGGQVSCAGAPGQVAHWLGREDGGGFPRSCGDADSAWPGAEGHLFACALILLAASPSHCHSCVTSCAPWHPRLSLALQRALSVVAAPIWTNGWRRQSACCGRFFQNSPLLMTLCLPCCVAACPRLVGGAS